MKYLPFAVILLLVNAYTEPVTNTLSPSELRAQGYSETSLAVVRTFQVKESPGDAQNVILSVPVWGKKNAIAITTENATALDDLQADIAQYATDCADMAKRGERLRARWEECLRIGSHTSWSQKNN